VKFALIGHPVAHSLSPAIHQAAYRELGEQHDYVLVDAASEDDLARVVADLRSGVLAGCNVTIPWKRQAFALAEHRSDGAARLGVANVLARAGGGVVAHNTDVLALEEEFRRSLSNPRRALIIGNGGAVPAVVAACQAAGIRDVVVTARRFRPDASEWPAAAELGALGARMLTWPAACPEAAAALAELLRETDLIVQASSAGMHGADSGNELARMLPWAEVSAGALAYDLIYAPLETPFLKAARQAGLRAESGLSMLVGQALHAIEIWFGRRPAREALHHAALEALAAREAS
jgi:shikimate dehydrogenase